jgi:hypothetical protein
MTDMQRRRTARAAILLGTSLVVGVGSGCTTIAKRTLKELQGAHSKYVDVPGTVNGDFDAYDSVVIVPVRTELGELVSSEFIVALESALQHRLTEGEDAVFPGGSREFTIAPQVMWYHEPGGLSGLLGSDNLAVTLFELTDGDRLLAKIQIVTKNASSREGIEEMAESMANELARWFEAHLEGAPPEED